MAENYPFTNGVNGQPCGYKKLASLATATGLGTPDRLGADAALIQVETSTQAVRWRDDGTAPTATEGFLLSPGDVMHFYGNLSALQFIEVVAGARVNAILYRTAPK